ncbi:MAG: class I SAM-dependent methyltransferase [Bacteroidales bacterium]|nr:class I SAM-dependent methyltransferase [Bacteroidales bacterium]
MNIAIIYQDTTINPMILSVLQSIFKMLENKNRIYSLITNSNQINDTSTFDVAIIVLLKGNDENLNDKISLLKKKNTTIIVVATKEMQNILPSDSFIDISPNFISFIKNGSLIYTLNKVLNDLESGKNKEYYSPILRRTVIQRAIKAINVNTYLEIGVSNGENFVEIEAPFVIGIDPIEPNKQVKQSLSENRFYFQLKSDEFFKNNKNIFEKRKIDLAFIDGAHNYHQALRDVQNCLNYLRPDGLIIMHDCNPISPIIETPATVYEEACEKVKAIGINPYGYAWTGDVWKTILNIRSTHKDLKVITLDCDFGLGIIKKATPESCLNYSIDQIEQLTYNELEKDRVMLLNLTDPEEFLNSL